MSLYDDVQGWKAEGRWYDNTHGINGQLVFVHALEHEVGASWVVIAEGFSGEQGDLSRTGKMRFPFRTDPFCGVEGIPDIPLAQNTSIALDDAVKG